MFNVISKIAYIAAILAQLLLSLRFILKFVNADSENTFAKWIFTNTELMTQPFRGLVQESFQISNFYVELPTLVMIVCLVLITSILSQMVKTL